MMPLPNKLFHCFEAVLHIAFYGEEQPIPSKKLHSDLGLPPRYLEAAMQRLVHADILYSIRGPRGGYKLRRAANSLTLTDIMRSCFSEDDSEAQIGHSEHSLFTRVTLLPVCERLDQQMRQFLHSRPISELLEKAHTTPELARATLTPDYTI